MHEKVELKPFLVLVHSLWSVSLDKAVWSTNNATCLGCILSTHLNMSAGGPHLLWGHEFTVSDSAPWRGETEEVISCHTCVPAPRQEHDCVPGCWEESKPGENRRELCFKSFDWDVKFILNSSQKKLTQCCLAIKMNYAEQQQWNSTLFITPCSANTCKHAFLVNYLKSIFQSGPL